MEFIKKLTTTGTSLCIIVDKIILDSLKLKKGDKVKINLEKEK